MPRVNKMLVVLGIAAGLGAAALPLGVYAETDTLTVQASVSDYISVSATPSSGEAEVIKNVINNGSVGESEPSIINVKTNATGYTVAISAADTQLTSGTNHIAAGVPKDNAATSYWGYRVVQDGATHQLPSGVVVTSGYDTAWHAVTTSEQTLFTKTSTATNNEGDNLYVKFGASTNASQPSGEYSGSVTFTATVK